MWFYCGCVACPYDLCASVVRVFVWPPVCVLLRSPTMCVRSPCDVVCGPLVMLVALSYDVCALAVQAFVWLSCVLAALS